MNEKLAVVAAVGLAGADVIVVFGAVVSIVQVAVAGWRRCCPRDRWRGPRRCGCLGEAGVGLGGETQAAKPPPSTWHAKVEPASVAVNAKLAVVAEVSSPAPT
ncbi:MAG: hypothetical protein H6709_14215 [Kofleriaceae bacterium]|nr:hypothetical protein [Kofleriaceae bacterium]